MSRRTRLLTYGLVLVLAVEFAVWGSFLTAARPFGQPLPVAAAVALVANLILGVTGARLLQRPAGAVLPGVVWLLVALALGSRRAEGDVVVTSTGRGLAFLAVGAVAATAAVGLALGVRATPEATSGR